MKQLLVRLGAIFLCVALVWSPLVSLATDSLKLTQEQYDEIDQALLDETKELPISDEFRINVSPDDLSVTEGLDENWMNILLLGTDTGNIKLNYGRTDTMMIMSVNRVTGKIRLASLVRDMKVNLPFYKNKYKINTANAFGGPLLAVKTVNEVFGLNIRHYVSINFNGFVKVIDSLGGVELVLTAGESRIVGVPHLDKPQLLDGTQALEYVRIRKLDDNFGRNERQRKLLSSLFNKMMKDSDIETAVKAMTEALRHMATNLSINDLLTLVVPVLSGMETMETTGFPAVGDYRHETDAKTNDSYIVFDLEATRQKLHNYIYQ